MEALKTSDAIIDTTIAKTIDWMAIYAQYCTQHLAVNTANPHQQQRIALILEQLLRATEQGDSLLPCEADYITDLYPWVVNALQAQQQVAPCVYHNGQLALYRYWQLEQRLSLQVARLAQQQVVQVNPHLANALLSDEHQRAALSLVCFSALSLITGGPGTGKTYTLARIIALLQHALPEVRIAMAAPTGKAAQRMQEALQHALAAPELRATGWISTQLQQQRTQTLHRLLGMGTQQKPRFNVMQPLPYDVIVVDEASMLDVSLATALFEAVPEHARLILLGDAQQLASVDVGAVLADLQATPALASQRVHLHNSRRFQANAQIGHCARFIQSLATYNSNLADFAQIQRLSEPLSEPLSKTLLKMLSKNLLQQFYQQVTAPITSAAMNNSIPDSTDRVQCAELPPPMTDQALDPNIIVRMLSGFLPYVQTLQAYQKQPDALHLQQVITAFDGYRILGAVKHGIWGVTQLNRLAAQWLQQHLAASVYDGFYVGRPIMMTYNDYQLGLSNGDIGICLPARARSTQSTQQPLKTSDLSDNSRFEVYFPSLQQYFAAQRLPKNVQDAFALTIHKSQGSEFAHCAVILVEDAEKVLSRELLYTAITRAKQLVSLWVHPQALALALSRDSSRRSGLLSKIQAVL